MASHIKPREGTLFGRTRSTKKENVAVYCDDEGNTCVSLWTMYRRPPTLKLTINSARVLHKALGDYLEAEG